MESVQEADSDSETDENPSSEESASMELPVEWFDGKKWTAFAQICLGIILVFLEIASYALLNPWFRLICPGIWIGVIFVATGGVSLAHQKLEHLQNKRLSLVGLPPPPSYSHIFRIIYIVLNAFSLSLCVAMIVLLAVSINSLRHEMRSPSESLFSMFIVMMTLYILVIFTSFLGFFHLLWRRNPDQKTALVNNDTAVSENTV